jgi:hypothetical protein
MQRFKKKELPIDPLIKAKSRQEVISRLEDMGYFVRPRRIRRPKVGDTVRFRVGAGWKINTHYYQTGIMVEFSDNDPNKPFEKYGYIRVTGKKSDHIVHPYTIVKVSKTKLTNNLKG